jgi:hypothetical protein
MPYEINLKAMNFKKALLVTFVILSITESAIAEKHGSKEETWFVDRVS